MSDVSVLWPESAVPVDHMVVDPGAITDLNIDQVLAAIVGEDEYRLRDWFARPIRDADAVQYRQEVFADLTDEPLRAVFEDFAAGMRRVRKRLARQERLRHPHQRQWWQLSAVAEYLEAVSRCADSLGGQPMASRALTRWREFITDYMGGSRFADLSTAAGEAQRLLDEVRYTVKIVGRTVEVASGDAAPDYSATIANLFSRFGTGTPRPSRQRSEWDDMDPMEEQILDRVATLNPGAFEQLAEFARRYEQFADTGVTTFDREIQFYLVYLAFVRRVGGSDREMCLPQLAYRRNGVYAERAFDLALLSRRGRSDTAVVCNDVRLSGAERVIMVTGPNQGGKTTVARTVGQLVYFAALGCPVPARSACLPLPDRLFTHFERAEQATDPDGRLAEELVRIRDTLDAATADSVIILNESFSTTSTVDAVRIGRDVLDRIVEVGSIAVWVTFFYELADARVATVSMVATTDPDDPSRRTFRIERRLADGHAHAQVLAERFGLTSERVTARITACK